MYFKYAKTLWGFESNATGIRKSRDATTDMGQGKDMEKKKNARGTKRKKEDLELERGTCWGATPLNAWSGRV